jgi:hypothetical protein
VDLETIIDGAAMDPSRTALERAFELARSGNCRSVEEIRKKLTSEGYSAAQLTGKGLLRQLQSLIPGGPKVGLPREPRKAPLGSGRTIEGASSAEGDHSVHSRKSVAGRQFNDEVRPGIGAAVERGGPPFGTEAAVPPGANIAEP